MTLESSLSFLFYCRKVEQLFVHQINNGTREGDKTKKVANIHFIV